MAIRRRRVEPVEPEGEPVCLLTAAAAHERRVPIDRLLQQGSFEPIERGYEVRLQADQGHWALANQFVDEEAVCCRSFAFELEEDDQTVTLRATY